eukprot:scaffold72069_cov20-Tisochrysis_lutea.AAC.3
MCVSPLRARPTPVKLRTDRAQWCGMCGRGAHFVPEHTARATRCSREAGLAVREPWPQRAAKSRFHRESVHKSAESAPPSPQQEKREAGRGREGASG